MEKHLTDGELRAALDGELDAASLQPPGNLCRLPGTSETDGNTEVCIPPVCLRFLPPADEPVPSAQAAWNRFSEEYLIKKENSMFKRWFSIPLVRFGTAALVILALVLAFPGHPGAGR